MKQENISGLAFSVDKLKECKETDRPHDFERWEEDYFQGNEQSIYFNKTRHSISSYDKLNTPHFGLLWISCAQCGRLCSLQSQLSVGYANAK